MNATDVIGYVVNECSVICADCLEEGEADDSPLFATSETDSPTHCERCEALLPEALTSDGEAYVREVVAEGSGRPEILAEWRAQWSYLFA